DSRFHPPRDPRRAPRQLQADADVRARPRPVGGPGSGRSPAHGRGGAPAQAAQRLPGPRAGATGDGRDERRKDMSDIRHRTVETNGIRMHVAEAGTGPLVVLCHGFPESWYSWRHQLVALAEAGFRAVAPDMRGYGQTDRPEANEAYTLPHLVGDLVGLLDPLGLGS